MANSKEKLAEAAKRVNEKKVKAPKILNTSPEGKTIKVTFSTKIDFNILAQWRAFSALEGYGDLGNMTAEAVKEYMENHPVSKEQKARYDSRYNTELENIKFSKEYVKQTDK